jgi:hypothetical protein
MANTPVSIGRLGACHTFATSSTSGATGVFDTQTYAIMVVATVATNIVIGNGPTASPSSQLIPANTVVTLTVSPGQALAAVSASAGSIFVSEIL